MKSAFRLTALGAMVAYAVALPAAAPAASSQKKSDPTEIVCEKQEVLGTRLGSKRVCKTRADWAEQRRLERSAVERFQTGANCTRANGQTC